MTLPTSDQQRKWLDFFATSSRSRPRDALQLLSILTEESLNVGKPKIAQSVVDVSKTHPGSQLVKQVGMTGNSRNHLHQYRMNESGEGMATGDDHSHQILPSFAKQGLTCPAADGHLHELELFEV